MADGSIQNDKDISEVVDDPLADGGLIHQELEPLVENPLEQLPELPSADAEEPASLGDGDVLDGSVPPLVSLGDELMETGDGQPEPLADGININMEIPSAPDHFGAADTAPITAKTSTLNATLGNDVLDMDTIRNIKVNVQAVLGGISMSVSKLSNLKEGELVSLEKTIGEEIEILANGQLIAHGEIVVIEGDIPKFGITITSIVGS